jgi:short-subunit dehydrogenase
MPTALITGASSGLGAEYAKQLAARGADLVLVARDVEALNKLAGELQDEYGVAADICVADLTVEKDLKSVEAILRDTERPIDMLINNAGFGLSLRFADNDLKDEVKHLRIHVEAPMRLIHAALSSMRGRGGRILNVASVAAFIPRSTYSANKRWQVVFSQWANSQYAADGVSVTAVCPGFTHTNFHERLGLPPGKEGISPFMWLNADQVVRESLRDASRGKAVSIPSFKYKVIVTLSKILPTRMLAGAGKKGRL